ncbi:MAG: molecular chaperone DnaJ [Anaerolineales bacterium]|nr:MAG: molecular chaperone DnaJ [Anaerolineales bacterium]
MASEKRDYYQVLGVARDAGKDAIRSAYRGLARRYHPDVNKSADAEARFKEINEAYQVLSDDKKRALYDRYGHAGLGRQDGGGFGGFGGFGDLHDIFGDFFGFGTRAAARPGPRRGADLRYDLEISFEEAVFGCTRNIEITRLVTCPNCNGSGAEPGTRPTRCPDCRGTGQIRRTQQSIFGSFVNVTTCPRCWGRGEVANTPCSVCRGALRVEQSRELMIEVPAGVDDGTRIRLAGEGESGMYGGPAGHLYAVLHVKPHRFFRRRDNDILLNLNISIVQAALGDEILVPVLGGEEKVAIPPGTQTGATFRLKGRGVPRLRRSGRGDEIVIINVAVPTNLSAEQKQLLAELGKTLGSEVTPQAERTFVDRLREVLGL